MHVQPFTQTAQVSLLSASQLQQSANNMDSDKDAFMLVRIYYFDLRVFLIVFMKKHFFIY